MTQRKSPPTHAPFTYNIMDMMLASPTLLMPQEKRTFQLTRMWAALATIEKGEAPTTEDWRLCSDAVNMMETLVKDMQRCEDTQGLLDDAVLALADSGRRHMSTGAAIRLDAKGIFAVRSVLEDYADMLGQLSHRVMIVCHMKTERRVREILSGKKQPNDVEVMAL